MIVAEQCTPVTTVLRRKMDKNSLMASLMTDGPDQDLFGDVPIEDPPVVAPVVASVGAPVQVVSAPMTVAPTTVSTGTGPLPAPLTATSTSLLAQSGLLQLGQDTESGSDAGGLFAAVDEEEEVQRQVQAQELEQKARQQQQQQQQAQFSQPQYPPQNSYSSQLVGAQPMPNGPAFPHSQVPPHTYQNQHQYQTVSLSGQGPVLANSQAQVQPQAQAQLQAGMQAMTMNVNVNRNMTPQLPTQGFYREHPPSVIQTGPPLPPNAYGGTAPPHYYYGTQQPPQQQPNTSMPTGTLTPQPIITAGMHNATQAYSPHRLMTPPTPKINKITLVKPPDVPPLYAQIQVAEPMLIQHQSFLISSPPYWSYQISTQLAPPQQGTWLVRRRFRHVVALEDRLRQTCPGSILPPRPDKHATRALEEASTQQSAEFAMQRARELSQYLNALAKHPVAGQSQVLRLFLGLQDDIGTAWPEVSGNAFTKLGAVAAGMSMKVAETTQLTAPSAPAHEWEYDAELLALSSSENLRMGAVSQAVPKLEGAVTNLREHGDAAGAVGMELSKVSKIPTNEDFKMCDVLSHGFLRQGRRNKRLALELSAAMDSFLQQYKMVRYEKMALQDRRQAIQRKGTYRRGADQRAVYLAQQQRHLQATGQYGQLNHLERSAIQTDTVANEVMGEAEEIAARLKLEIHRVAIDRRTQWNASMKTIASAMKEACSERLAIWESTLEALKALPGGMPTDDTTPIVNGLGNTMAASLSSPIPGNMMTSSHNQITGTPIYHQPNNMNASIAISQNPNQQLDTSTIYA